MESGSVAAGTGAVGAPAGDLPAAPAPPGARTRRHVIALGVAVVAIAAVALLLAVATGQRPAAFAPDTPEGSFQTYLAAWDAKDLDAAYATFSDRVHRGLTLAEYRSMARDLGYPTESERRVVLVASTPVGDRATLELRIDELGGGGMFGTQTVWSHTLLVDLIREGGQWRLDQALAGLEPVYWSEK